MKKHQILSCLLAILLAFALTACGGGENTSADNAAVDAAVSGGGNSVPYVTSSIEYTLYQNIFYNDQISDYEQETMTKTGTFATIHDSFSNVDRYYVWGYYDETKCCDWQWEFVMPEGAEIPTDGSLIEITGTFTADENALDGCWLTDVTLTVQEAWEGSEYDVDMSTMNATLERVQLVNMQYYPDEYKDQTVRGYGRVESTNTIQHPYYDGMWSQTVSSDEALPAIGTPVLFSGTFEDGTITNALIEATDQY